MEPFTTKQLYYSDNSARPDFYVFKSLENTFIGSIFRLHPLTVSMLQPLQRVPPHDLHPAELHRGAAAQHPQVAGVQARVERRQHEPGGEAGQHDGGSAANRLIGEVLQSRRRPLLGPSPG